MKLEEKIRIFAHYLYCKVKSGETTIIMQSIDANTGCITTTGDFTPLPIEDCNLILKSLRSISRKDACKCAELANLPCALYKNWQIKSNLAGDPVFTFPDECPNYRNQIIFTEDNLSWKQVDYLRSQGYAIGIPKEIWEVLK